MNSYKDHTWSSSRKSFALLASNPDPIAESSKSTISAIVKSFPGSCRLSRALVISFKVSQTTLLIMAQVTLCSDVPVSTNTADPTGKPESGSLL